MRRFFITMFAAGMSAGVVAQDPQPLTFDRAMEMTLNDNPEVKAVGYEQEAAIRERKAAYGLRLPQVGVTGSYVYMGSDIALNLNGAKGPVKGFLESFPAGFLPPEVLQQAQALLAQNWSMKFQDRSFGNVSANVTVPIYTGGKINAANNAAKIRVDQANEKGEQVRNALVSELTERYFGLSLALQVVQVREQVLEGMRHHLRDAEALEANGIIAKGERLYAEVHTAQAERELLKARKQVETLNSALKNTLGNEQAFVPASDMFILNQIEAVDYFKNNAVDRNPLLRQVGNARLLAVENMRLQRADFAPQVALTGLAALYNYQVSPLVPKWAIGAGVSFKIFDGLHREYKFSASRWQIRQAEAVGKQAQSGMLTLIDKLYNEMISYSEQLPSVDASFRFATEYLRIKQEAFKEGMSPSSDVVDAQLNLAKIKIERLQAAYYYDLMLSRLLEAAGISETFPEYARRSTAMTIRFEP